MIDNIVEWGLPIVALFGFFLVIRSSDDTKKGRNQNRLGFDLVLGPNLLAIVYNAAHSFQMRSEFGVIFNIVCLIIALVGSILLGGDDMTHVKKSKRTMAGLITIVAIMSIQFIYTATGSLA